MNLPGLDLSRILKGTFLSVERVPTMVFPSDLGSFGRKWQSDALVFWAVNRIHEQGSFPVTIGSCTVHAIREPRARINHLLLTKGDEEVGGEAWDSTSEKFGSQSGWPRVKARTPGGYD